FVSVPAVHLAHLSEDRTGVEIVANSITRTQIIAVHCIGVVPLGIVLRATHKHRHTITVAVVLLPRKPELRNIRRPTPATAGREHHAKLARITHRDARPPSPRPVRRTLERGTIRWPHQLIRQL